MTVEDSIALNFALMHEENLRYVAAWSKWILWEERRWLEDNTLVAFDLVRQECRKIRNYLSPNEPKKLQVILGSAKTVVAVERLAKSDRRLAATSDQWDCDPDEINTNEGTV